MQSKIELFCKAEQRTVGTIVGEVGETLRADVIRHGFKPAAPDYALKQVVDGVGLQCPRCGNALLFKQAATGTGVYAVPGTVRVSA